LTVAYDSSEVHDGFDPAKHYRRILRRDAADSYLTGQDENESASIHLHQVENIGKALLADGSVIEGAGIIVDADTGGTTVSAGKIAAFGLVREPAEASFTVPTTGELYVGIWIETSILDEDDDAALIFNPPGTSFPASGSAMSPRERELPTWGKSTDIHADTATVTWRFVPVYRIVDGVVVYDQAARDPWDDDLERYDREAHGSYSVSGFVVSALGKTGTDQIFSISAGTVNAWGRKIDWSADRRMAVTEDPPERAITGEYKTFADGGSGTAVLTVKYGPVTSVDRVEGIKSKTVTLTKGVAGSADALPDSSIQSITEVKQGGTTYTVTTDYLLDDDTVDWSPGGSEPSPGTTYDVTYRYYTTVAPDSHTDDTITVSGFVTGTQVALDYHGKVRRIDVIAVDRNGDLSYYKGGNNPLTPAAPDVPDDLLALAEIDNDWRGTPAVTQKAVAAITFAELAALKESIRNLQATVSRLSLQVMLSGAEPSSLDSQFVDAFDDDRQRDLTKTNTAAVAGGALQLPLTITTHEDSHADPVLPAFTLTQVRADETPAGSVTLPQSPFHVDTKRVGSCRIVPAVDNWFAGTGVVSPDTEFMARPVPYLADLSSRGIPLEDRLTAKTVRALDLTASMAGVTPAATLDSVTFDGVSIDPGGAVADGSGECSLAFTIPANLPLGSKTFEAIFSDGTIIRRGWGTGTVRTPSFDVPGALRALQMLIRGNIKPVAKVSLQVHASGGTAPIYWQALRTDNFMPGDGLNRAFADGVIDMTSVAAGDWIDIVLPVLYPGTILLALRSADGHQIKTAVKGSGDYVSEYAVGTDPLRAPTGSGGTLVSRVSAATMTAGTQELTLMSFSVTAMTDLMLTGSILPLGAARTTTRLQVTMGSTVVETEIGKPLHLDTAYTGTITVKALATIAPPAFSYVDAGLQAIVGAVGSSGAYTTRTIAAADDQTVAAFTLAKVPVGATMTLKVIDDDDAESAMSQVSATARGEGWFDYRFEKTGFSATSPRLKIELAGDVEKLPYMDDFRAVVVDS
jgi:hypothetical protein